MARNATLSSLRTLARQFSDTENSTHVSDAEVDTYLNFAYTDLRRLLSKKWGEEYFLVTANFAIGPANDAYPLPSDFYKLRGVDVQYGGRFVPMRRFMWNERSRYVYSQASIPTANIKIHYIPTAKLITETVQTFLDANVSTSGDTITLADHQLTIGQAFTLTTTGVLPSPLVAGTTYYVILVDANTIKVAASLNDALAGTAIDLTSAAGGGTHTVDADRDVIDGVQGYEEMLATKAALYILNKEESDDSSLAARYMILKKDIEGDASRRDVGFPKRIIDVAHVNAFTYGEPLVRYQLQAGQVKFINTGYLGV